MDTRNEIAKAAERLVSAADLSALIEIEVRAAIERRVAAELAKAIATLQPVVDQPVAESVADEPEGPLSGLRLMDPEERKRRWRENGGTLRGIRQQLVMTQEDFLDALVERHELNTGEVLSYAHPQSQMSLWENGKNCIPGWVIPAARQILKEKKANAA